MALTTSSTSGSTASSYWMGLCGTQLMSGTQSPKASNRKTPPRNLKRIPLRSVYIRYDVCFERMTTKCREQRQDLHLVFIDLVKTFDSVDRDLAWRLLEKSGVPSKLVNLIRSFHVGMQAKVSINGETTLKFDITTGFHQGCILAPACFTIVFSYLIGLALGGLADNGFWYSLQIGWQPV